MISPRGYVVRDRHFQLAEEESLAEEHVAQVRSAGNVELEAGAETIEIHFQAILLIMMLGVLREIDDGAKSQCLDVNVVVAPGHAHEGAALLWPAHLPVARIGREDDLRR